MDVLGCTQLMLATGSRQLMLDMLQERVGSPLLVRSHPQPRLEIVEVVRACSRMPGAVSTMVEVVVALEPGTTEAERLRRLQDEWEAAERLAAEDWSQLRPVLHGLHPPELGWLFQRAVSYRLSAPPGWCADAWHVYVHLAGHNAGPDGVPPSLAFLTYLEEVVDAGTAELLRLRTRGQAARDGNTAELERLRSRRGSGQDYPADGTAYLVIRLEPCLDPDEIELAAGGQRRYTLSYCRQWHGADAWHFRQSDTRPVRRADLAGEVERLIHQTEEEWSRRPRTTLLVEFILPWDLLNAEVDWWQMESASAQPVPLAMDYPVVVRSLKRHRTPRWHHAWRRRWQLLRTAPASATVHWSRPDGDDYFTRLEAELKSDHRIVSLILSEPPTETSRVSRQEVEAALRAGLPVIIWHRLDCSGAAFRDAVTRLVSDGGLAQLPVRAKELRSEALRLEPKLREDHIGRHLAVLWDDPERMPDPPGPPADRLAGEIRT